MLTEVIHNAQEKINIPIEEIDIDKDNAVAIQYGIRSVPTMILLDKNNIELKRVVGSLNQSDLLTFLKG
jgi:thioredoxin-like negative regulator of GroEL